MKPTAAGGRPAAVSRGGHRTDRLNRDLMLIGIVNMLVGAKLMLSYWVPGLKSSGELLLSGGLLLITAVSVFRLRATAAAVSGSRPRR